MVINKEKKVVLPPGFSRKANFGIFPMSQVVTAALEGVPNPRGLYAVTFSPDTLAALRSGDATLMHSVAGDRAVAVRLNGEIRENATIVGTGLDVGRACFATASLLTGQYFLARIDHKLDAILSHVQDILEMLDSAERADLHLATGYVQALFKVGLQGSCSDKDASDLRKHRDKCLEIAMRNLVVLNGNLTKPRSRRALGPKEHIGEMAVSAMEWADDRISWMIPSRREEQLLEETGKFAEGMTRGLIALQAILCFGAILEPEATSRSAAQSFAMTEEFETVWENFQTQFRRRKEASLTDFRYFKADEKRKRLEQELNELLEPVNGHWETLKDLENNWLLRFCAVPDVLYVSVNDTGDPVEIFLPD